MRVVIGSDHAGYDLKKELISFLQNLHLDVSDFGTDSGNVSCDYPDIALQVAKIVASDEADRGILICGSGIGMSIAANKVPGAYCALCRDQGDAELSRRHNDANILALPGRGADVDRSKDIVSVWLKTDFEGDRHVRRTQKIRAFEHSLSKSFGQKRGEIVIFDHPLVQHKVSLIRDVRTSVKDFRDLVQEISSLMVYEITRDLPLEMIDVETPLTTTKAYALAGKKLAVVPILRAGMGMMDGILDLVPNAKVGFIGLYRDPETLEPVEYYCKLPGDINEREIFILDPMLATGGSAVAAIDMIKKRGARRISLVCLISAPEGVERVHLAHSDVNIYCAALDSHLNDHGYIVPGLGDAGDRLFGTK
ncbi:MAG: uracil phosphoribosyltransferase [Dethiosulfovibrio peptidovorans]|nr:MAG: uracil phosphoribosyltransferase [Dethiosulfovibrio peptidovorans]